MAPTSKVTPTSDPPIKGQKIFAVSFCDPCAESAARAEIYKYDSFLKHNAAQNPPVVFEGAFEEALDEYSVYKKTHRELLNKRLDEMYKTGKLVANTHRAFKMRGVYARQSDAEKGIKKLIDETKDTFSIFTAKVGEWCPFNPAPDEVENFNQPGCKPLDDMVREQEAQRVKTREIFLETRKKSKKEREFVDARNAEPGMSAELTKAQHSERVSMGLVPSDEPSQAAAVDDEVGEIVN